MRAGDREDIHSILGDDALGAGTLLLYSLTIHSPFQFQHQLMPAATIYFDRRYFDSMHHTCGPTNSHLFRN